MFVSGDAESNHFPSAIQESNPKVTAIGCETSRSSGSKFN